MAAKNINKNVRIEYSYQTKPNQTNLDKNHRAKLTHMRYKVELGLRERRKSFLLYQDLHNQTTNQ
jgi:hypothetical protein